MLKKGKKTKSWERARRKLKKIYADIGITTCEIRFPGCKNNNFLTFAHRYKRRDPRCKHDLNGTVLACIYCHNKIEYNRELSEKMFERLRGIDE